MGQPHRGRDAGRMAAQVPHDHRIRKPGKVLNPLPQDIGFNHPISHSASQMTRQYSDQFDALRCREDSPWTESRVPQEQWRAVPQDSEQERSVWSVRRGQVGTGQDALGGGAFPCKGFPAGPVF